jgi:O-antigen ligase
VNELVALGLASAPIGAVIVRALPLPLVLGTLFTARVLSDGGLVLPSALNVLLGVAILFVCLVVQADIVRLAAWALAGAGALWLSSLSADVANGAQLVLRAAVFLAIIVAVQTYRGALRTDDVLRVIVLAASASAVTAIFQIGTGTTFEFAGDARIPGSMAHPNSAALLYALGSLAAYARCTLSGFSVVRTLPLALTVLALSLTVSLGGGLTLVVMLSAYEAFKRRGTRAIAMCLGLAGSAALFLVLSPTGSQRIASFSSLAIATGGVEVNSFDWRLGRWSELLYFWQQSPVIGLGYGGGESGAYLSGYLPHNEYLRTLVDVGVVGALAMTAICVAAYRRLIKASREGSALAPVGLAALTGSLVNALSDNTFTYSAPCYLLAMLTGAALRSDSVAGRDGAAAGHNVATTLDTGSRLQLGLKVDRALQSGRQAAFGRVGP